MKNGRMMSIHVRILQGRGKECPRGLSPDMYATRPTLPRGWPFPEGKVTLFFKIKVIFILKIIFFYFFYYFFLLKKRSKNYTLAHVLRRFF